MHWQNHKQSLSIISLLSGWVNRTLFFSLSLRATLQHSSQMNGEILANNNRCSHFALSEDDDGISKTSHSNIFHPNKISSKRLGLWDLWMTFSTPSEINAFSPRPGWRRTMWLQVWKRSWTWLLRSIIFALFERPLDDVTFPAWIDDLFVLLVLWHINPRRMPGGNLCLI